MATPDTGIQEADKPFILALIGTLALVGIGAYAAVFGKWDNAKDFVGTLVPLVAAGWGYYFKSKS